jgi:hypothetical protein
VACERVALRPSHGVGSLDGSVGRGEREVDHVNVVRCGRRDIEESRDQYQTNEGSILHDWVLSDTKYGKSARKNQMGQADEAGWPDSIGGANGNSGAQSGWSTKPR